MKQTLMKRFVILALVVAPVLAGTSGWTRSVEAKAEAIRFDRIEMEDATPKEIFDYLREQAKERDPEGIGINVIYRLSPRGKQFFEQATLTLTLKNVSFAEVVDCVRLMTGLQVRYARYGLMISDAGAAGRTMQTKIYHLKAGVLDTTHTRDEPDPIDGRRGR